MAFAVDTLRLVITGQSGTGKTTLAVRLACASRLPVVAVSDVLHGWEPFRRRRRALLLRVDGRTTADVRPYLEEGDVLIEVGAHTAKELPRLMERVAAAVWDVGERMFILDEAHRFFPRSRYALGLERLCTGGRHRAIDLAFITQHVTLMNITALKTANRLAVFRAVERNDVERMADFASLPVESIKTLPNYYFFYVDLKTGRARRERVWPLA